MVTAVSASHLPVVVRDHLIQHRSGWKKLTIANDILMKNGFQILGKAEKSSEALATRCFEKNAPTRDVEYQTLLAEKQIKECDLQLKKMEIAEKIKKLESAGMIPQNDSEKMESYLDLGSIAALGGIIAILACYSGHPETEMLGRIVSGLLITIAGTKIAHLCIQGIEARYASNRLPN
jgi:hypothetical protein